MVSLPEAFKDRSQNRLKLLQSFSKLSALSLSARLANDTDIGKLLLLTYFSTYSHVFAGLPMTSTNVTVKFSEAILVCGIQLRLEGL